ncbi:MAG TPA: hypothetical protein PKH36_08450, partial [Flavobacteriales bacterium]|nr:hypothetical protein [Flavobacteriales bacterium]
MSTIQKLPFHLTNTLTRKTEEFIPLNPPHVGLYVCGPTVYSDVHLGNVRSFTTFDVLYRWLSHIGYKVRYVRNITDVGHLVDDVDAGEDKIAKRARLEQLEPMEIVQKYTNGFHDVMRLFNVRNPSIEPTATAHLIEQIGARSGEPTDAEMAPFAGVHENAELGRLEIKKTKEGWLLDAGAYKTKLLRYTRPDTKTSLMMFEGPLTGEKLLPSAEAGASFE